VMSISAHPARSCSCTSKAISIRACRARANDAIVALYIGVCLYAFVYFLSEYEDIAIWRQGSYTTQDFVVGLLVFLLVMELSRLAHPILFWINLGLIFYTLWGYLSPIDFFWHPGTTFYRVVTSSTVELSTGVYGLYGQLALTLIAAFLLLAAAAQGFGAQKRDDQRDAAPRRPLASDGAADCRARLARGRHGQRQRLANAAVVGTITIPLMMRYGVPATFAAAVETSASMGGLIMPPMMGVGAFLMSDFLGVPYFEVVIRGLALAIVYYLSIALAVYLLCVRLLPRDAIVVPAVLLYDRLKTVIFFAGVLFLVYLMGFVGMGELLAALYTATLMLALLLVTFLVFKHVRKDHCAAERDTSRQSADRDRDPCRDDVLSRAAAGDARDHDRAVHRDRLHQPYGRDAARSRRLERDRQWCSWPGSSAGSPALACRRPRPTSSVPW